MSREVVRALSQKTRKSRTSIVLLAGAMVVAGSAALFAGDDHDPPPAQINGEPLTADNTRPEEIATFEGLADTRTKAVPLPTTNGERPKPVGTTAPLGSLIDLDQIKRNGDVYEAPLADGRIATLTLDPDLQPLAEKLLVQARAPKGAIVVMSTDGRILALAGRRTEEPEGSKEGTFDWRLATDVWAPAASVFKLVTASALVDAGVDGNDKVCFHGGIRSVMESNLVDSKKDSRCESLAYGVAHSNNAILGKLAFQRLTPESLDQMARTLGFVGALPGKELPGNAGNVAIPPVRDLSFAKTAAGFANTELSVAGGAVIAAIDGQATPVPAKKRVISASAANQVARMMAGTCENGSAAKTFRKDAQPWKTAGKTGTLTRNTPFYMEHSWFVGFAPADKPSIVVSVVFGNPEDWYLRGHEAARRLIDRALRPKKAAKS
jgi:peptidoglycan glycosyltransferase